MEKVLEAYVYSFTDRYLKELMASIGKELVAMGLARQAAGGVFGTVSYVPTTEAIHGVTDMVRAELLEDGEVTDCRACHSAGARRLPEAVFLPV